jgi:hypothetical protein
VEKSLLQNSNLRIYERIHLGNRPLLKIGARLVSFNPSQAINPPEVGAKVDSLYGFY